MSINYLTALSLTVGIFVGVITSTQVLAADTKIHGIVDVRASSTNTSHSYLDGGQGKFANNNGNHVSLAQAGLEISVITDSGFSGHLVANGYINGHANHGGLTELYIKYKSLPNSAGYRFENRTGMIYPNISLENKAYAWASIDTLNSSTLNTWIGEEIRVLGSEFTLTKLGNVQNHNYDLSFSATIFSHNDPAGAMLAWHGWTQSSQQTIWPQQLKIPAFPGRFQANNNLHNQAPYSEPYLELDHSLGEHFRAEIRIHHQGELSIGYYNNNAKPYIIVSGQWGWHTQFYHAGLTWRLPMGMHLTAQYLSGKLLMQDTAKQDLVNNTFGNEFISVSKRWQQHQITARVEHFWVRDHDNSLGDNNNDSGNALTLNYRYRVSNPLYLSVEYNWINSDRPAHAYAGLANQLTEQQWQVALRYFF